MCLNHADMSYQATST